MPLLKEIFKLKGVWVMKTTTLQRLKDNNACKRGYDLIANHVGVDFTGDIPLETILDNNGLDDCILALRATDGGKEIAQEFAIRVSKKVYFEPSWVKWADNWLDGTDRSKNAAAAAAAAAADAYAANAANAAAANAAAAAADANAAYAYAANAANAAAAAADANAAYAAAAADAYAYAAADAYAANAYKKMKLENTELLRSLIK
jgi:hypothetical protein